MSAKTMEQIQAELKGKAILVANRGIPARRICRVRIETTNGHTYISDECEPRGEAKENIGVSWLCDKFRRITAPVLTCEGQQKLIELITGDEDVPIRTIVDTANAYLK